MVCVSSATVKTLVVLPKKSPVIAIIVAAVSDRRIKQRRASLVAAVSDRRICHVECSGDIFSMLTSAHFVIPSEAEESLTFFGGRLRTPNESQCDAQRRPLQ